MFTLTCNKCNREVEIKLSDKYGFLYYQVGLDETSSQIKIEPCGYMGEVGIYCNCGNHIEER